MERIPELYKYRHISFDLWLTLIKSDPEFKNKRNLLFKEYFSIGKPMDEVAAVIRKFDILTNSINEKVCRNFDTFEIYYLILDALGVSIENFGSSHLEEFYGHTHGLLMQHKPLLLDEGLPGLLQSLSNEGITMNILSNTAFIKGSSLREVISHYGLESHFAFQAYSDETGYSKPGTRMYQYAFERINEREAIAKHEILHVGDNRISDYDGAINFGFHAHLITNSQNEHHLQPA